MKRLYIPVPDRYGCSVIDNWSISSWGWDSIPLTIQCNFSGIGFTLAKFRAGIAIDNSGNIYVVETINHRIQKFTSNGNFITKWGSEGKAAGQFKNPKGIAIDNTGNVYVTDTGNNRIQCLKSRWSS
jgi:DNA-binding beta-propeller fold protein YncE